MRDQSCLLGITCLVMGITAVPIPGNALNKVKPLGNSTSDALRYNVLGQDSNPTPSVPEINLLPPTRRGSVIETSAFQPRVSTSSISINHSGRVILAEIPLIQDDGHITWERVPVTDTDETWRSLDESVKYQLKHAVQGADGELVIPNWGKWTTNTLNTQAKWKLEPAFKYSDTEPVTEISAAESRLTSLSSELWRQRSSTDHSLADPVNPPPQHQPVDATPSNPESDVFGTGQDGFSSSSLDLAQMSPESSLDGAPPIPNRLLAPTITDEGQIVFHYAPTPMDLEGFEELYDARDYVFRKSTWDALRQGYFLIEDAAAVVPKKSTSLPNLPRAASRDEGTFPRSVDDIPEGLASPSNSASATTISAGLRDQTVIENTGAAADMAGDVVEEESLISRIVGSLGDLIGDLL